MLRALGCSSTGACRGRGGTVSLSFASVPLGRGGGGRSWHTHDWNRDTVPRIHADIRFGHGFGHAFGHAFRHAFDMCLDMRLDMCLDMRSDMCLDVRLDMRPDMGLDMRLDMRSDICLDMCFEE